MGILSFRTNPEPETAHDDGSGEKSQPEVDPADANSFPLIFANPVLQITDVLHDRDLRHIVHFLALPCVAGLCHILSRQAGFMYYATNKGESS